MLTPLANWVFAAMVTLMPPRQNDVPRLKEMLIIAIVTADASMATPLPGKTPKETAATLTSIAFHESGFRINAIGKLGERGPWQLLNRVPAHLRAQAGEAIHRWRIQGPAGYTGEGGRCPCPLAKHRIDKAKWILENIPDVEEDDRGMTEGCLFRLNLRPLPQAA